MWLRFFFLLWFVSFVKEQDGNRLWWARGSSYGGVGVRGGRDRVGGTEGWVRVSVQYWVEYDCYICFDCEIWFGMKLSFCSHSNCVICVFYIILEIDSRIKYSHNGRISSNCTSLLGFRVSDRHVKCLAMNAMFLICLEQ